MMKVAGFYLLMLLAVLSGAVSCKLNEIAVPDNNGIPYNSAGALFPLRQCDTKRIDDEIIRILFVGNSLTYTNNLPKLLENRATSMGKKMITEMLAFPNYALEDHWHDQQMQSIICQGNFDFVVVQQGPSSQAEGRAMLMEFGQLIQHLCTSRGTELAFFMVWPAKIYYHTFDGVIKNYSDAAMETKAHVCAVGAAFKIDGDKGDFWFYGEDAFHPSYAGSVRATEIIYTTLIH